MTNIKFSLIRILLVVLLIHIATAKKSHSEALTSNGDKSITNIEINQQEEKYTIPIKHRLEKYKHLKKEKRQINRKNWGSSYARYDPPPYLVYNKKTGAYYPYYNFQKNEVRRNGYNSYRRNGY